MFRTSSLTLYFLLFLMVCCHFEDPNSPSPSDSFIRYYGGGVSQEAFDLEPIYHKEDSSLSGFIIFGTREQNEEARTDIDFYFILTDIDGNLIASKTVGYQFTAWRDQRNLPVLDSTNVDVLNPVPEILQSEETPGQIEVTDSGFIFVGTARPQGIDKPFVVAGRLNKALELLTLNDTIPSPQLIKTDAIGNDIIATSDGGVLIVGAVINEIGEFDFYYSKHRSLNESKFEQVWEVTSFNGSIGGDDILVRAFEDEQDNYMLFGYNEREGTGNGPRGGTNVFLSNINQINGDILYANTVGNALGDVNDLDDILRNVIEVTGGYVAVGTTVLNTQRRYSFFMNFTYYGLLIGEKIIITADSLTNSEANAITRTYYSDYVLVGVFPNFTTTENNVLINRQDDIAFIRLDQDGTPLEGRVKNFGLQIGNDVAVDAITLQNGKIIMLSTVDFGSGISLISLTKFNEDGALDN